MSATAALGRILRAAYQLDEAGLDGDQVRADVVRVRERINELEARQVADTRDLEQKLAEQDQALAEMPGGYIELVRELQAENARLRHELAAESEALEIAVAHARELELELCRSYPEPREATK